MAVEWENYGRSSLTILSTLSGLQMKYPGIPHDPSDFNRCIHLFECLDYTEGKMYAVVKQVAKVYPIWQPIANYWIELKELYDEERTKGDAPKLYKALRGLPL
jgi:hypothetical protein